MDAVSQLIQEIDRSLQVEYGSNVDIVSRLLLDASRKVLRVSAARSDVADPDALCFDTLIALADEQINNVDFHVVSPMWSSLYVDTNLLSALYDIAIAVGQQGIDVEIRDRSVRKLDMAIIVGGATKPRRIDWIQRAIKLAQVKTGPEVRHRQSARIDAPRKRRRLNDAPGLSFAPKMIPTLVNPPSIEVYLTELCNSPFVLRGYFRQECQSGWPAMAKWKDPEYLLARVGHGRCVPVEEGRSYDDFNWGQRVVPFVDFLDRAGFAVSNSGKGSPTDRPMYLAQHSLFRQFPELKRDMSLPDYVRSRPHATKDFPSYRRPATEDGTIVNVWVGSGSCEITSPAHTDPYYNCYAQVLGQKRIWVAPPECGPYMGCHGEKPVEAEELNLASQYMRNTSTIPVLRPDVTSMDVKKNFPDFEQHVWPHCMEIVLDPGDLFVMPPGWWHAMRGEGSGPGWSVSMWY